VDKPQLVRTQDLGRVYGTGEAATHALREVTLTINEGEFVAIIGQSGSGKSTLLNMLGLLDTPTTGVVEYRGEDVSDLSKDRRSALRNELIGFVFQFHYLLPEFSVYENVAMPPLIGKTMAEAEIKSRANETLDLLGLNGLASKNANDLSGGQKQRVAIARALMNKPALLLADEPTGNLDTVNTRLVYDLFRRINDETGTAFAIVTHDRRVAQQADRVIEVSDGAVVSDVANSFGRANAQRAFGLEGNWDVERNQPADLTQPVGTSR